MEILEALGQLNPLDDEQWTVDGLPSLATVNKLVGKQVKRQEVTDARPDFSREVARAEVVDTAPPELEEATPKSRVELLEERLASARAELDRLTNELSAVTRKRDVARHQVNQLIAAVDRVKPKPSLMQNIQDYLSAQNRQRAKRAETLQQVREHGLDQIVKDARPAPIDTAMKQRKPARGSQRPPARAVPNG